MVLINNSSDEEDIQEQHRFIRSIIRLQRAQDEELYQPLSDNEQQESQQQQQQQEKQQEKKSQQQKHEQVSQNRQKQQTSLQQQLWPSTCSFQQNHFLSHLTNTGNQHHEKRQQQKKPLELEKQQKNGNGKNRQLDYEEEDEDEDEDDADFNDPTKKVFRRLKTLQQRQIYNISNRINNSLYHQHQAPYSPSEVVFAKCKGQPLWPCKILSIQHIPGLQPQQLVYHVKFINDNNLAIVNKRSLLKFNARSCEEVRKVAVGNKKLMRGIKMAEKIVQKMDNRQLEQLPLIKVNNNQQQQNQRVPPINYQQSKQQTFNNNQTLKNNIFQPIILVNNTTNMINKKNSNEVQNKCIDDESLKREKSNTCLGNNDNDKNHNQNIRVENQTRLLIDDNLNLLGQKEQKKSLKVQTQEQQKQLLSQVQATINNYPSLNNSRQRRIQLKQQHLQRQQEKCQQKQQQKYPQKEQQKHQQVKMSKNDNNRRRRRSQASSALYGDSISPLNIIVETPRIAHGHQMLKKIVLEFSPNNKNNNEKSHINPPKSYEDSIINSESEQQQSQQEPLKQQYTLKLRSNNLKSKCEPKNNVETKENRGKSKPLWKKLFHEGNDQTRMEEGVNFNWGQNQLSFSKHAERNSANNANGRSTKFIIKQEQSSNNSEPSLAQKNTIHTPKNPKPSSQAIHTYLEQYIYDLDRTTRLLQRQRKQKEILEYFEQPLEYIITKHNHEGYCNIVKMALEVIRKSERENINERFCMDLKDRLKMVQRQLVRYQGSNNYLHKINRVLDKRLRNLLNYHDDQQSTLSISRHQEKQQPQHPQHSNERQ